MTAQRLARPDSSEYASFYAAYIAGVPDGDLLGLLERQLEEHTVLLSGVPDARGDFAYAPGKWTLKEVLGHVVDAERVFSYRVLRFARADATPLAPFDETAWVPNSGARGRSLRDLIAELRAVRTATLALLRSLPAGADTRRGTASGYEISVRALAWIIAGHERHHFRLIRERYLD